MDEGYIKYQCSWEREAIPFDFCLERINYWRDKYRDKDLIGETNGIGFGNISQRFKNNEFIISGTATGGLSELELQDCAHVINFDIESNSLACRGLTQASSEALTHGAVYLARPEVMAVVHFHALELWKKYLNKLPTTSPGTAYGTPQTAREVMRLVGAAQDSCGAIAMGGHQAGLIAYGRSIDEAAQCGLAL